MNELEEIVKRTDYEKPCITVCKVCESDIVCSSVCENPNPYGKDNTLPE